ncbi:TlyA family RNA methyltransferase [Cellulosilyticum lentocellum]|uniref:Hemolysin A n=1 Tax=Cellulosilyticum lentocellum (strain ATCC 49066 / DSM 5427 / NCIMB 11756 / RHM5) TaxID=642492 RepID=F2JMF7_CELLD|nr:TlyA family RNA methyltransferase [Cellulosilyticum lentocellum]ADZ83475.1 hemolysin A [Cellulosilyticum lentocellum DSM 5427]
MEGKEREQKALEEALSAETVEVVIDQKLLDSKERLDVLIAERQLAESRERAKAYIMAGVVFVNGQREDKPGLKVKRSSTIEVREKMKYVSRGGFKLEKAMTSFNPLLKGKVCMDVGASTGGFTDCMLQNGAIKVYSVDVGYGQFAWKLRQDPRVICMEKTNIRYLTRERLEEKVDFCSIDVSFISLTKVLEPITALLQDEAEIVALIKPQFEAGREQVEKHGVVRKAKVHEEVIHHVWNYSKSLGFGIRGLDFSPIKGPEGNIEYLIHLKKQGEDLLIDQEGIIKKTVQASHECL